MAAVLAIAIDLALPLPFLPERFALVIGVATGAAGLAVAVWASVTMHRAHTSPIPGKPTTTIVQQGPFRFSRNPIYLSMAALLVSVALVVNSVWGLLLLPAFVAALHYLAIVPEEAYLERRFGDEFRAYRARVRRWV